MLEKDALLDASQHSTQTAQGQLPSQLNAKDVMKTEFWNRKTGTVDVELVYGEWALQGVYGTRPGQFLADHLLSKSMISQLYGVYQSSRLSSARIPSFIEKFKIPMEEFEDTEFKSFNEFFIRKFKPGLRPFIADETAMGAFAEARYYAYKAVSAGQGIPVKGGKLTLQGLLGDYDASDFEGGPVLLARLCPVDYHRFHFPDAGHVVKRCTVNGGLHSVNPLALGYKDEILVTNERQVTLIETQNFGLLAYVEVGALCVGKIVQTYTQKSFQKGDEKGYFLFGGSTVVVLGQPGKWVPDADLLEQTAQGRETLVQLGTALARASRV